MYYYFYYRNNIKFWKIFCIIITVLNTLQTPIVALKCYICGEPDNVLLNINTTPYLNPASCDEFNHVKNGTTTTTTQTSSAEQTKLLEKFIMNCPEDYQGCITQIQDGRYTRSCDVMPIDDCQTANGITYCYCSYDLCNIEDETKSISTRTQTSFKSLIAEKSPYMIQSDDEDYFEMSGDRNPDIKEYDIEEEEEHHPSQSQSSSASASASASASSSNENSNANDLNEIAREHNERVSTILKILSTGQPITTPSTTTTTTINIPKVTTNSTTASVTIEQTTKIKYIEPSTTSTTSPTNTKVNSWTFRNYNYDDSRIYNSQPSTTKRTTDLLFPTTSIYNRNTNSNQNHSNLIQFTIHLIIIPLVLVLIF